MTRINALRNIQGSRDSVAWGKNAETKTIATAVWGKVNTLIFAAVLIVCSIAVGCSSEKPKPVSSNIQIPAASTPAPVMTPTAASVQPERKPAAKKIVHRKPATVNYADKTYGVTFEYPRRYAIETGNAAGDLLMSSPVPMNFVAPGGLALAAVELPETGFANTDFASAFFDVSVHKGLTADQCTQFAVPQPKIVAETMVKTEPAAALVASTQANADTKPAENTSAQSATPSEARPDAAQATSTPGSDAPKSDVASTDSKAANKSASTASSQPESSNSKLLIGDMELRATEAVSGEGTRQSDAKYFHVYQNGACYEFALNVTTVASQDGLIKHVDRDRVFSRLEKILDTVKINQVTTPEVTAEAPATPSPAGTPAQ